MTGRPVVESVPRQSVPYRSDDYHDETGRHEEETEDERARMSLGMHHYCFVVPDLEGAVRWYSEKLYFDEVERRFGFPEAGTEIVHLVNDGGIRIELIAREGSVSGPDAGRDVFVPCWCRAPST